MPIDWRASKLNAIVDAEQAVRFGWRPIDLARAFLNGGARFLQLRAKRLAGAELLETAAAIAELARASAALFVVNDRADIARLAGAGGVHLGQDDLPPSTVRPLVGAGATIGLSTHTSAQLEAAASEPVEYLAIGPVFGTNTKATGYEAVGLAMVRRAVETGRSIVGIGGITLDNAPQVIEAGASSVAVISDLLTKGDPEARVRAYIAQLERI